MNNEEFANFIDALIKSVIIDAERKEHEKKEARDKAEKEFSKIAKETLHFHGTSSEKVKTKEPLKKTAAEPKPFVGKRLAAMPMPVLYDRKKKINNKEYSDNDWIMKIIEEALEVFAGMGDERTAKAKGDDGALELAKLMTDREIMDVITVCVSLLYLRGVDVGSKAWNSIVNSTDCKNDLRGALDEH